MAFNTVEALMGKSRGLACRTTSEHVKTQSSCMMQRVRLRTPTRRAKTSEAMAWSLIGSPQVAQMNLQSKGKTDGEQRDTIVEDTVSITLSNYKGLEIYGVCVVVIHPQASLWNTLMPPYGIPHASL